MNQNDVNLNQIFFPQEWKNIILKIVSMFIAEAFQFIIEKYIYNIQINHLFVTM